MKKEYIDDDRLNGLEYDFTAIKKEFKKLKIPADVYNPSHLPLQDCKWFITMSERARGKTTNLLLLGLCFRKLYGTQIQYLRTREIMITKKNIETMFSNIVASDQHYVQKLTDDKYNNIVYKARKFYYANTDADGNIIDIDETACCVCLSIDKAEVYKSAYETGGVGDFIIFDEFIEKYYYPSQFLDLCQLLSTIIRKRQSPLIFLSANTIDKNSPFFSELMINDAIDTLDRGESKIVTTPYGTKIYCEILGKQMPKANKKQSVLNKLFFGFQNPKLVSITGAGVWAVANYPHTPEEYTILNKQHYLEYNDKLVRLEVCRRDFDIFINCHYATKTYDDSVIYSLEFPNDKNHRYKLGFTKADVFLWDRLKKNLFTYSDNSVGALVESYYNLCLKSR